MWDYGGPEELKARQEGYLDGVNAGKAEIRKDLKKLFTKLYSPRELLSLEEIFYQIDNGV